MRILILKFEIEEHISLNLEFCDQFKLFFLKWVQLFSTWAFSTNFVLKLSTSSKWEYKFSISERHNFLCVETDGQMDLTRSTRLGILIKNIYTLWVWKHISNCVANFWLKSLYHCRGYKNMFLLKNFNI